MATETLPTPGADVAEAIVAQVSKNLGDKFAKPDDVKNLSDKLNTLSESVNRLTSEIKVKENTLDDKKRGYKSLEDFMRHAKACSHGGPGLSAISPDERELFQKSQILTKGPSSPSGSNLEFGPDGGFLLPPEYSNQIIESVFTTSNLLSQFVRLTTTGESLTIPAVDESTRTLTSVGGGFFAVRKNEVEQMTGGKVKLREVEFVPKEIYGFAFVTDKMLRNIPNFAGFAQQKLAEAIQHRLGSEVFDGTGVAQFLGLNNSPSLITVAKEANQANASIVEANLAKMRSRLPASSWSRFIAVCNQDIQPALDLMTTVVRNVAGTENVGGFGGRIYSFENDTIFGRPIVRQEYCSTLGDAGDLWFIDPAGYYVVARGTPETAASMHLRFDYAETAYRIILEIDGKPILSKVQTPLKGSTTLSHAVRLGARS